jgi:flagellar hook-basal body complex protein FliE
MAIEGTTLPLLAPHARFEVRPEPATDAGEGGAVFAELLKNAAVSANERAHTAERAGEAFAAGQVDDIHGTMLALSKADIELRVLGNVRNRVVDAFYELWRMQI